MHHPFTAYSTILKPVHPKLLLNYFVNNTHRSSLKRLWSVLVSKTIHKTQFTFKGLLHDTNFAEKNKTSATIFRNQFFRNEIVSNHKCSWPLSFRLQNYNAASAKGATRRMLTFWRRKYFKLQTFTAPKVSSRSQSCRINFALKNEIGSLLPASPFPHFKNSFSRKCRLQFTSKKSFRKMTLFPAPLLHFCTPSPLDSAHITPNTLPQIC